MSGFAAALNTFEGQYNRASAYREAHDPPTPYQNQPTPSTEDVRLLVEPLLNIMKNITCYEVMGTSTQVVVVDYDSPLTVAFIAAQESRVTSCSLWDSRARKVVGVMTISDYIRVLLYCHNHPEDVERVSTKTVRQWREFEGANYKGPPQLVAAAAEEPLVQCIQRMIERRVNRLPIFNIDPDATSPSIVSMMTYAQILGYLSRVMVDANSFKAAAAGTALAFSPATQAVLGVTPPTNSMPTVPAGVPYASIFDVPVALLGFQTIRDGATPITVTMDNRVVDALKHFVHDSVHALPIIDDRKIIIDVISRNDVMRLETGGMYDINKTLAEALSFRVGGKVPVFTRSDTLRDVTLHFVNTGVQEMFCVDEKDGVVGQLCLVDIVKCFFAAAQPVESTET